MIRCALLVSFLGLALLAAACGDGGSGATRSPGPTGGGTPTIQPSETPGEGASPTAAIDQTPSTDETPSPGPAGTPVLGPVGPEFDATNVLVDCALDAETSVADCGDQGTYAIDPPVTGEYTDCDLYMIQDQPVMLICRGDEQVQPAYYGIPPP